MKKIYALSAALFCAGAAMAEVPAGMAVRTVTKAPVCEETVAGHKSTKSVNDATRDDEWKDLGDGMYREGLISSMFRNVDAQEYEVSIQQNVADPNRYRVVNPYSGWQSVFSDVTYDAAGTYYLYFTTFELNGKKYWYIPEECRMGLTFPEIQQGCQGMFSLKTQLGETIAANGPEAVYEKFGDGGFGVVTGDGVFTYPKTLIAPNTQNQMTEFSNMMFVLSSMDGTYFQTNMKGMFCLTLPGVKLPEPPDPWEGFELIGECEFANPILSAFYNEKIDNLKVTVYQEPDTPGYLHLKGAFGDWAFTEEGKLTDFVIDATDPNYVLIPWQPTGYIDEENGYGSVEVMSSSEFLANYAVDDQGNSVKYDAAAFLAEFKDQNIYVDPATNRIVLPATPCIRYVFPNGPKEVKGYVFAAENPQAGYLQLPKDYVFPESGVNDIVAAEDANAPVQYYNLQGVKINNPESGALVIKKQGSKVTKLIVR